MPRRTIPAALLVLVLLVAPVTPAAEVTIGDRTLTVADGFEVELVAGPPLVERPIAVAADEQGRLYVTDSAGMSDRADVQLKAKPHRVRRLEDTDGDGRFDKSTVFADRMMFPEGCMWHDGSLYVAAPPQIWKLTDTDGDGVCDKREVWHDGKTLTGCANDLHGPYLGRDGWFYWCKGAFAEQTYTLPGGKPFASRASHIFRARPDGTGIEPVLTGGMDNPVNVAFLSNGERILSCTFFQNPAAGRRDGLIHAIYGGVYGKVHDVLAGHVVTGDVMPVLSHQGAAAPCGLIAGSDALFGGGHEDQLLACYFNLHKVVRHELTPDGATYTAKDFDLLSCEHPDFHPTDVFEDANGSVLIVDTGGWYKVCCPTSVLAKPDVLGGIYRVRKKGAPKVDDPRGAKLGWAEMKPADLAKLLADRRPFVRKRATGLLRNAGAAAVGALRDVAKSGAGAAARREAVWALAGIDAPAARETTRGLLADADRSVRRAAVHAAGLWRDREAVSLLLAVLPGEKDDALVRAVAEALGRIGDRGATAALLKRVADVGPAAPDAAGSPGTDAGRILEHSLVYALMETGDEDALRAAAGLSSRDPRVRRAGLVALDQLNNERLRPRDVVPLLDDADPILRNTAAWIVGHRPQWGPELVGHFRSRLAHPPSDAAGRAALAGQLAKLGKSPAIQEVLAATLRDSTDPAARQIVLRAMADAGLSAPHGPWLDAVAKLLPATDDALRGQAVATARALPKPRQGDAALTAALIELGRRRDAPANLRLDALQAAGALKDVDAALFADLLAFAKPGEPLEVRSGSAAVLAKATLSADQFAALADALKDTGPMELPKLLPAFERAEPTEALGMKLVSALTGTTGRRGLRADLLKPLLAKYPMAVQQAGKGLLGQVDTSAAEQSAHLDQVIAGLPKGDVNRGQAVFVSKKAACVSCHATGYLGGRLGPDLTGIGKIRTDRDLVEAIVYPNAGFVRGYEPVVVELRGGDKLSGIVTSEAREEVVVATGPAETQRLPRADVVDVRPAAVSLMPEGFETVLTKQELADVVAFVKSTQR